MEHGECQSMFKKILTQGNIIACFLVIKKIIIIYSTFGASLIAQLVKNPPAMQETLVRFLGGEDPLEKEQATHSSILGLPLWLSW